VEVEEQVLQKENNASSSNLLLFYHRGPGSTHSLPKWWSTNWNLRRHSTDYC